MPRCTISVPVSAPDRSQPNSRYLPLGASPRRVVSTSGSSGIHNLLFLFIFFLRVRGVLQQGATGSSGKQILQAGVAPPQQQLRLDLQYAQFDCRAAAQPDADCGERRAAVVRLGLGGGRMAPAVDVALQVILTRFTGG